MVYLIMFISDCLQKLSKTSTAAEASKALQTHAVQNICIPGDAGFPLNGLYQIPASKNEADVMRSLFLQLRTECAARMIEKCFVDGKISKWWLCFQKRKFMNKSL